MAKFEGTVENIVFRNDQNGWTVAAVRLDGSGRTSVVGVLPFLEAGEHAIFEGELVEHRDYGTQIRATGYELTRPETESAIERYLGSGLVKGIGPKIAKMLVKKFGARTLEIIENEPIRLTELPGIGPKRAALISESFAEQNGTRNTMMFLQNYGITASMAMKIIRAYGETTEHVVKTNPYRLVDEIEGIGFKTADEIAARLGFAQDSDYRIGSGIRYVLDEAVNGMGHMYLPVDSLSDTAKRILNVSEENIAHEVESMLVKGTLIAENEDGQRVIYLKKLYEAERDTARMLILQQKSIRGRRLPDRELFGQIERYEAEEGVTLCEEQREAVIAGAANGITVITGGPGTGKTTSINCLIRLMKNYGTVELAAPTGRAAKRMTEATGMAARTLHRLLEYGGDGMGFARDEDDPLDADTVIVDEVSMVDIFLMRSLLRALRPGTRLILVGDADQLPSVGAGNVLRDLIASGVIPVVSLTQIFRQASRSMIVVNAHRINHGEYPEIRARDTDFFMERKESVPAVAQSVVALVRDRLPKYMGLDPVRDIQVMAPMKRGDIGVFALNHVLQEALNPHSYDRAELKRGDTVFRVGDKVMQIRNDYDLEWTSPEKDGSGVFNGDIGYITAADSGETTLTVEMDDGRTVIYDASVLDELELAYCMSVHKSQGSEFAAVVLPLYNGPSMLMTRNLLYTAVTRAKKLVVITGRETCVRQMVDNDHIMSRYSALARRLSEAAGV